MSYRRIFSLREFALCLVVLTNAFGLGVVILTTAMATSPALASIEAGGSENGAVGVTERVDEGGIGTDVNDATSDTTAPTSEALPGLSSGKEPASGQVSLLIGDAVATKATHIPEESSGGLSLVDATNDSLTQIPIDGNLSQRVVSSINKRQAPGRFLRDMGCLCSHGIADQKGNLPASWLFARGQPG